MKIKEIKDKVKNYLVDTTGLLLASTPIYAAMETLASGMSVTTSFESRLKASALAYCGLGFAYVKGRDLSKRMFNITKESPEKAHSIHDSAYNAAFNIACAIPIYLSSGADLEQALKGAAGATALGLISGPINGYSIDSFREFVGTKSVRRMPRLIENAGRKTKKALAIGMVAAMLAGTWGVYDIKTKYFSGIKQEQKKEQSLEQKALEIQKQGF